MVHRNNGPTGSVHRRLCYASAHVLGCVAIFFLLLESPGTTPLLHHHDSYDQQRNLQRGSFINDFILRPLVPVMEAVNPFYRPNHYALQPISSFTRFILCTDGARPGCDFSNTLRFTAALNPAPNEFRYHNTGPPQLQGVFWTQQNLLPTLFSAFGGGGMGDGGDPVFASTDLVSFARTRHGSGIQTGVLQTNADGFEYVARPVGDHSWSTSQASPSIYLSGNDPLYQYDLVEGTLSNPTRFVISISFKVWFDCLRYNMANLGHLSQGMLDLSVDCFLGLAREITSLCCPIL